VVVFGAEPSGFAAKMLVSKTICEIEMQRGGLWSNLRRCPCIQCRVLRGPRNSQGFGARMSSWRLKLA
jgi:hypothetical protein